MADKKLRAGVIGARLGAAHAYAYANSSEYELVAVCDLFPKVIDEMWERAKLPEGSVRTYTDYKEMFEKENLDVVSVTVPDHLHADPVCDAADAGIKGVFSEKPLTINLEDADRIIDAVNRNGTKMSVDHTRSFALSSARPESRSGTAI